MKASDLTLEKYFFLFYHTFMIFVFFSPLIMRIFTCVFKKIVFGFTTPFTFSEIMKALVLAEHLSKTGF